MPAYEPTESYLEKRIAMIPESSCWWWLGKLRPDGYGIASRRGVQIRAHRFVYETYVGVIPRGLTLDHLCRNPMCVNPRHLEPVTASENVRRALNLGAVVAARQRNKTQCRNGHPYDKNNTRIIRRRDGAFRRRLCITCERAVRKRIYRERGV